MLSFLPLVFTFFSYLFPAVGLAAIASKALTITDEDFILAARTLAELVPQGKLKDGCCYPDLSDVREVSQKIAAVVAKHIFDTGRSDRKDIDGEDYDYWRKFCNEEMYDPSYPDSVGPVLYEEEEEEVEPTWTPSERAEIRLEQEKSIARQSQLFYLEKIIALYRFYVADGIVGNWNQFISSVNDAKSKLRNKTISEASYNSFIDECSRKVGFDIVKLMKNYFIDPICCFSDSLTIEEQKDFLREMESYGFQSDLKTSADVMLKQLATVSVFQFMPGSFEVD
jgi:hypothetical protein